MPMGKSASQATPRIRDDFLIGEWLVQPSLGTMTRRGVSAHLEPKTMQLLVCLAHRPGAVVSKDELLRVAWPDTFVSEHVLTHAIWQLRQVFGNDDFLQTVPRRGYRLTVEARPAPARIRSVAVLPLRNFSGDPEDEYFADGSTESLITGLAQIGALRVISRTSAMAYKASSKTLPQIAGELNVDAVVEGAVQRAGNRMRVSVQLIQAASDEHLWARTFEADVGQAFALQDEVARAIAEAVHIQLTPHEEMLLTRSRPVRPEAHLAYLKGRYCWNRLSEDSIERAIALYKDAIALDPEYPLPYIGLADTYGSLASPIAESIPASEARERMLPLVKRALELDPAAADALQLEAWMKFYFDWDWRGAEKSWQRILETYPNCSIAHCSYGLLLGCLERHAEAVAAHRRACELDPLSLPFNTLLAWTYTLAGQLPRAEEQARKTLVLEPNFWFAHEVLGYTLMEAGQMEEAISELELAVGLAGNVLMPRGVLGKAYARGGRTADARKLLRQLEEASRGRFVPPILRAVIYFGLRDIERTFQCLEDAYQARDTSMTWLKVLWKPLAQDPRHADLMRRMRFPE